MIVYGKATYLKAETGTSNRNGETRTWNRAAFLDSEMNSVSFYYDDFSMLDGMKQFTECELTLSVNQGRSGFFINLLDVKEL